LRLTLKKIAPTNSRVLITGPMGSGKEMAARVIHDLSLRAKGHLVTLSAARLSPETVEEELFGVEDGQGNVTRIGALEEAHAGTLYLDELADMPLETQGKILRVLLDQTFQRVGGSKKVKVDVRIVSSTSRDLPALITAGTFREDLYHRLGVVPVRVPPLSERREDIPELVNHFVASYATTSGQAQRRIAEDAMTLLQTRNWPGNVRELRNNVDRMMILAQGEGQEEVTAAMLPSDAPASANGSAVQTVGGDHLLAMPLREAREAFERDYIVAQLGRFGGNISRTSLFIGMERSALHRKIKLLGLAGRENEAAE
jgi:two-component system, NtrC family, nitrogen regulation response regulator NtrX